MIAVFTILISAVLNRFRGGGVVPVALFDPPCHRRFWTAPLVGLVAWLHLPAAALIVLAGMSAAYEIAWRVWPEAKGPTARAKWMTGAAWGAALLVI